MTGVEMLKTTTDELDRLLSPGHMMGDPIDFGDKMVIPVAKYGFGFGAGAGNRDKEMGGAGTGAAGGIMPVALIIVHKDVRGIEGVQILSLKKDNPVAQIVSAVSESLVPQLIEAIKTVAGKKEQEKVETCSP